MIKGCFIKIADSFEEMVSVINPCFGAKNYFYVSDLNINSNSSYLSWNGKASSSFNLLFFNRIIIHKPEICNAHKEWLLSLKKYSTLISGSNEMAQAQYLKKQREYINWL
ncbi:hypothetical protein M2132_001688 [Dysgonomonas sp. PH5-45]|uniref:hypothetical protein n=1 Tax=unclassified Dysgonomonas TaxID=2630389 RepID=UPI0024750FCD|nr:MULTISPECIES: hypothetical protein [unclassified Dysgonomonas]MDH6355347.1 hypothetical protein [Dysgonomonas sp. PH5-45]MDH6388245.1 hypothetical protein [Dysgonomonas sp. PH5-37]